MLAQLTIDEALTRFLDEQRKRLSARTFRNYEDVIGLLRDCLSGYGPNMLSGADHDRWRQAYDDGDEDAFCTQMSAACIVDLLDEFLGYFMVRKVIAGQELLRASGTVTKKLVRWLQDCGLVDPAAAENQAHKAASAARDLPNAERLANALYEISLATPIRDRDGAQHWIEHDLPLTITKTEPGKLWFEGDIGPLPVPRTIDQLAQTGWAVTAVLAYARQRWWLVEVGNVYP
ncbi:MAG: hypothetical protein ACRDQ5_07175 [Sciscionella sp.]